MDARHFAWTLCLFIFANLVGVTEGYTCTYYDVYGYRHYLYCGYSDYCCGPINSRYCCYGTGTVVGAVVGSIVFVIIVASIISCCCCACCPVYQYRSRGTVIATTTGPNYQTIPHTTVVETGPYTAAPAGAYTGPPPSYQK